MTETVVKIYDTTLRDGLRNSGAILSLAQKIRVARQLEVLRVDAIEVGYGGPSQVEPMQAIAQAVSEPVVFGLSRVNLKDVRRVLRGVESAKKPGINVFIPTSGIFLDKMALSRQQALDAIIKACRSTPARAMPDARESPDPRPRRRRAPRTLPASWGSPGRA